MLFPHAATKDAPAKILPRTPSAKAFRLASFLTVCGIFAIGWFIAFNVALNADEGFYLLVARSVANGATPYRDFGFTQAPVMPWIYAHLLPLFGWDLMGVRLAGLFLTITTVCIGLGILRRHSDWRAVAVFGIFLAASPAWAAMCMRGKTYALAGLAVTAGTAVVLSPGPALRRWIIFTAAAAIGVGTRLPTAPFFLVGWIYFLFTSQTRSSQIIGVSVSLLLASSIILFTAYGAWREAWFWTVGFHASSMMVRPAPIRLTEFFSIAPVVWFVLLACGTRLRSPSMPTGFKVVTLALLAGIIANTVGKTTYGEYSTPFVPAAALIGSLALQKLRFRLLNNRWVVAACCGVVIAVGWSVLPPLHSGVLSQAAEAAAFVSHNVPSKRMVVGSMPEIAVASGYQVPASLTMGTFSMTEDFDSETAARLHFVTPESLAQLIRDPQTGAAVFLVSPRANFAWSNPTMRGTSREGMRMISTALTDKFRIAYINDLYVIFLPIESARKFVASADQEHRDTESLNRGEIE